jgi:hypothetical protein
VAAVPKVPPYKLKKNNIPAALPRRERVPGIYWIGGWVDPRACLDDVKKKFLILPGQEVRPLSRPARSQSPYRLNYPGS